MHAYRQTFRRHRLLLILPVLVAAAIAGLTTFRQPPTYASYAALWVDNGPAIASSVTASAPTAASVGDPSLSDNQTDPTTTTTGPPPGPAGLESEVVAQLLLTSGFDDALVRRSGGISPLGITAAAIGPQVLWVRTLAATASGAQRIARALISQLGAAGAGFGQSIGRAASIFYRGQLEAADALVANNQGAVAVYVRTHPSAAIGSDPAYRALVRSEHLAESRRTALQAAGLQANTEALSDHGSGMIRVLDPPSLPSRPAAGLAFKLTGLMAGGFAGLVLSLLALILLTPRGAVDWDAEVPLFARLAAWDRGRATPRRSVA